MDQADRAILNELFARMDLLHEDLSERLDDLRDQAGAQNEGVMRIIDRLGPADPPTLFD